MSWRTTLLTMALCFGLGLGLAPMLRSAHACSCEDLAYWELELEQIAGDGDPSVEEGLWPSDAWISDDSYVDERATLSLGSLGSSRALGLERVQ